MGGRPTVKGDVVAVLYDDHTVVVLSSSDLAESDLLAAAASLDPGDPSLPKPDASDPASASAWACAPDSFRLRKVVRPGHFS
ncbi:MAG TPA: hypothetical protein VHG90_06030 [Acidimicrobiales bacterium]|nr:hypothetical protein [Acidimicrobiales bacterium]